MKKRLICLIIAVCIMLVSCEKTVKLTEHGFIDPTTGIHYVQCSASLSVRPLTVENKFATDGNDDYFTIQWQEPTEFLCDSDSPSAAFVYHAEDVPDVTFDIFEPIAAFVYLEGGASVYLDTFYCAKEFLPDNLKPLATQDDSELVYAIRDAVNGGEHVNVKDTDMALDDTYYLRMLSAKYPGLYYIIVFFKDINGICYLEDRSTGTVVVCPENVKLRMVG